MNIIKLTRDEVYEVIEGDGTNEIEQYPTKHDCHATVYVFKRDDKFYRLAVEYSYNDGMQMWQDTLDAVEVIPWEVKRTEWRVKKD